MSTLQAAIQKIDAETRELLMGTFDTVNQHFGRMFPELFGGGQARLVMTGDEVYAGVQVVAQPPGKKNQTIHLLSGGEKALTAIALVFAIFQLNPATALCLLDEVDNAGRCQHRTLCQTCDAHEPQHAVFIHQPQQNCHGNGTPARGCHHARAGCFCVLLRSICSPP